MKKKMMTLRGRALCATLALVLTAGLVPSQALTATAYAANDDGASVESAQVEPADASADRVSQDVALESSAAAAADAAADRAEGSQAASSEGTAFEQSTASAPVATGKASVDADDILSIQMNVNGEGASETAIAFGGLVYTVNDDGENAVTLTGWTGNAPKGALTIPGTIRSGQADYSVTRIAIAGGGHPSLLTPQA